MVQEKKDLRPKLELEAEALAALEEARTMPAGPERTEAVKKPAFSEMPLTCRDYFLRSAEDPGKLECLLRRRTGRWKPPATWSMIVRCLLPHSNWFDLLRRPVRQR